MYTRKQFGDELKKKIKNKESTVAIGEWAYFVYFQHMEEIDQHFKTLLKILSTMEEGPEFERSYDELENIADRLIAGEDVTFH